MLDMEAFKEIIVSAPPVILVSSSDYANENKPSFCLECRIFGHNIPVDFKWKTCIACLCMKGGHFVYCTLGRLLPHARGLGFKPRRGGFPSGAKKEWGLSPNAKVRVLHTAQLDVTGVCDTIMNSVETVIGGVYFVYGYKGTVRDNDLGEANNGEVLIDVLDEILIDESDDPVTSIIDFTGQYKREVVGDIPGEEMGYLSCDNIDKTERGAAIDQSIFSPEFIVLTCSKPQTCFNSQSVDNVVEKY
nr:ATP-dependent DNA helicase RRM3-like [Tanacetum cinerariifolium]